MSSPDLALPHKIEQSEKNPQVTEATNARDSFIQQVLKDAFDPSGHKKDYASFMKAIRHDEQKGGRLDKNLFPDLDIVGVSGDGKSVIFAKHDQHHEHKDNKHENGPKHYKLEDLKEHNHHKLSDLVAFTLDDKSHKATERTDLSERKATAADKHGHGHESRVIDVVPVVAEKVEQHHKTSEQPSLIQDHPPGHPKRLLADLFHDLKATEQSIKDKTQSNTNFKTVA